MAISTETKKVYDFSLPRVKNELVQTLKKRRNESSIADLIADTGLPKYQVEQGIKVVSNEYNGHLRVTESGELLYYFPSGMRNQVKGFLPGLKRFASALLKGLVKVLALLFKIWIVVMLVGYFLLFLAILVLSIALAIAGTVANKDRGRSGKGGVFYLVFKVFELFARIWFYGTILDRYSARTPRKKKGRPLPQAVFGFVFGEKDLNRGWQEQEKKYVIAFIQTHKGIITLEEIMALTGRERDQAQQLLNQYLLEYEGSPEVTEEGSLIYFFPELLRTTTPAVTAVSLANPAKKKLIPFSFNPAKTNGWVAFFNVFNLLFSSYFIGNLIMNPLTFIPEKVLIDFSFVYKVVYIFLAEFTMNPNSLIFPVLGIVPVVFSFFFFLIPFVRNLIRKQANNRIKKENFNRRIYNYFFQKPQNARLNDVVPAAEDEKPAHAEKYRLQVFDRFAADTRGDIDATENGEHLYNFSEFKREIEDVQAHRSNIRLEEYAVGKTVFDSGR